MGFYHPQNVSEPSRLRKRPQTTFGENAGQCDEMKLRFGIGDFLNNLFFTSYEE